MNAEWSWMWIVGLLWLYSSTEIRESHWSDNDTKTNMRRWSVTKTHRKSPSSTSCLRSIWTNQRSLRDKAYWTVQTLNTHSVLNLQSFVLQSRVDSEYWCFILWELSFIESGWNYIQRIKLNRTTRRSEKNPRDGDARTAAPAKTSQNTLILLNDTPLVALVIHFTFILVVFIAWLVGDFQ